MSPKSVIKRSTTRSTLPVAPATASIAIAKRPAAPCVPTKAVTMKPIRVLVENQGSSWILPLKQRLEFSGWLQFAMPAAFTVATWAGGTLAQKYATNKNVSSFLLALRTAGLGILVFDVLTVKFQVRPFDMPIDREALKDATNVEIMLKRRSCRSFQTQPLTEEDRQLVLTWAAEATKPSALLSGKISIRMEYLQAPLTVWPAMGCKEFLVAIAPKEYNRQAILDVGRAIEQVVLKATRRGIATCIIGPGTEQNSVIRALGRAKFDPDRDHIILSCAFGYKSYYLPLGIRLIGGQMSRTRLPLRELFFQDASMKIPVDTKGSPMNQYVPVLEACRWSPSSINAQTTRAVCIMGKGDGSDKKLERVDFYASGPSRYYAVVALGIWMRHWETACDELGFKGHFEKLEAAARGPSSENHTYDFSWIVL